MRPVISPKVFQASLQNLLREIQQAQITCADTTLAPLAVEFIRLGQTLDLDRIEAAMKEPFYGPILRDQKKPTPFTSVHILGKDWADDPAHPLLDGEIWNRHNRASNTGIKYNLDEDGYPVNPFFNYGVKERGVVGRFGPNHAVDIAPCRFMANAQGQTALHVLGIVRTDNGDPAFCGGFTMFEKDESGHYPYTAAIMHRAQTHELFEEIVSGSVTLLPQYGEGLQQALAQAVTQHEKASGHEVSDKQKNMMLQQMITQRKLQQVEKEDPQFMRNLYQIVEQGKLCFSGPVLSSGRNTNTAWMESRLSWFMLDEQRWSDIKNAGKFGYRFQAGDDAADVMWHEVTPELLHATASHGPLFCYLMSSLLVNSAGLSAEHMHVLKTQAEKLVSVTPTLSPVPSSKPVTKYPRPS